MRCLHPVLARQWQDRIMPDGTLRKVKTNSFHYVPCGKCVSCLSRRRNDWTFRLSKEQLGSSYSFFLTLTYDNDQIPIRIRENVPYFVFNKKHVQDYLKRVRYYVHELNSDILCRYFCVSEYGSKGKRPHYHMQFFVKNDNSFKYYKQICNILKENWKFGYFQRKVTSPANIHYVTKYCIKSLDHVDPICIDSCFILMSKRPYIGECAESDLEKQPDDMPVVFSSGSKLAMPRIYRNHLGKIGFGQPESIEDPRFNSITYDQMKCEYYKLHGSFDAEKFAKYVNCRVRRFEQDAIRRQLCRNEKL